MITLSGRLVPPRAALQQPQPAPHLTELSYEELLKYEFATGLKNVIEKYFTPRWIIP